MSKEETSAPGRAVRRYAVYPSAAAGAAAVLWLSVWAAPGLASLAWGGRPAAPAAVRPPAEQKEGRVEAELITALQTGFEPSEITRPEGEFLLVVNNRTGLEEINLRLEREAGNKLREVKLRGGKLRSGAFEDLPPGRYVLTEAGHPDWVCRITITPN